MKYDVMKEKESQRHPTKKFEIFFHQEFRKPELGEPSVKVYKAIDRAGRLVRDEVKNSYERYRRKKRREEKRN